MFRKAERPPHFLLVDEVGASPRAESPISAMTFSSLTCRGHIPIGEPRLLLMDRLHRQPWLVCDDPQQSSCRPGWTAAVLLPVLQGLHADANQARKLQLRKAGSFANRPYPGSPD